MSSINPTFDVDAQAPPASFGAAVYRVSDGTWFDFAGSGATSHTFTATPTTYATALTQIGATGTYAASYTTTSLLTQFVDGPYLYFPWDMGSANARWTGVGVESAYLVGGNDQYGPATVSLSGGDITNIANAVATALNASGVTLTSSQQTALVNAIAAAVGAGFPVVSGSSTGCTLTVPSGEPTAGWAGRKLVHLPTMAEATVFGTPTLSGTTMAVAFSPGNGQNTWPTVTGGYAILCP